VVAAERERDGLVVVLAGFVVEPVDSEAVLPEPDPDELAEEVLVIG
jgi:hypothetical protein